MPYLGNQLEGNYTSFETQTITGDGSTSYTLSNAVTNGKELLVYINNVKQEEGSGKSYTASGTTITFSDAVASTDSCYVVYLGRTSQTVSPPDGSLASYTGNASISGDLTVDTNTLFVDSSNNKVGIGGTPTAGTFHIFGTSTTDQVIIENTNTGDGSAPDLVLFRKSTSSAADGDVLGRIDFRGLNDANEEINYATIFSTLADASDGTENGKLTIQQRIGSSYVESFILDGDGRVGIGITPSPVSDSTGTDSLQLGGTFLIHFDEDGSGTTSLSNNLYYDGSNNKALFYGSTSQYYQLGGTHYWRRSGVTSAGANATVTEQLRLVEP